MIKQHFQQLMKNEVYEEFLGIFPENLADTLFYTTITYSKETNVQRTGSVTKRLKSYVNEEYLELIYNKLVTKNWLNEELESFKGILLDLKRVDQILKPIKEVLDLNYTISLTGGSIRDLVSGKYSSINDLDIIVELVGIGNVSFEVSKSENKNGITEKDRAEQIYNIIAPKLKKLDIPDFTVTDKGSHRSQLCYHIVHSLLEKQLRFNKVYPPKDLEQATKENSDDTTFDPAAYNSFFLQAVLKLEDNKLHYPIDILLSSVGVNTYNNSFDFDICKIYFDYTNLPQNLKDSITLKMSTSEVKSLLNKINYNSDFIEDFIYKKLTFNVINASLASIEYSLEHHYKKLSKKYDDYKFYLERQVFNSTQNRDLYDSIHDNLFLLTKEHLSENLHEEVKNYFLGKFKYNILDEKIPFKSQTNKKLKKL